MIVLNVGIVPFFKPWLCWNLTVCFLSFLNLMLWQHCAWVWLGLGTKNTLLKIMFWLKILGFVAKNVNISQPTLLKLERKSRECSGSSNTLWWRCSLVGNTEGQRRRNIQGALLAKRLKRFYSGSYFLLKFLKTLMMHIKNELTQS